MLITLLGNTIQVTSDVLDRLLGTVTQGCTLKNLIGRTVEVTTGFGPVSGTLVASQFDYLVLESSEGQYTYVPYANIESISVQ